MIAPTNTSSGFNSRIMGIKRVILSVKRQRSRLQQKASAFFEVGTFISIWRTSFGHKTHEDLHKYVIN